MLKINICQKILTKKKIRLKIDRGQIVLYFLPCCFRTHFICLLDEFCPSVFVHISYVRLILFVLSFSYTFHVLFPSVPVLVKRACLSSEILARNARARDPVHLSMPYYYSNTLVCQSLMQFVCMSVCMLKPLSHYYIIYKILHRSWEYMAVFGIKWDKKSEALNTSPSCYIIYCF